MRFAGISAILAVLDLACKWLIERKKNEEFPVVLKGTGGRIWLHKSHNSGFPFGFLKEYGELVRTLPLMISSALGGVFVYLLQKKGHTAQKLGLAVILGGAASNLYDRCARRYVVDYFSIQAGGLKKVIFNLGDLCVFAGTAILFCAELVEEMREKHAGKGAEKLVKKE